MNKKQRGIASMVRSESMLSKQSRDIANRRQDIAKRVQESADKHETITELEACFGMEW